MASRWQNVGHQMNAMFLPGTSIADTGKKFRAKHGHDGKGSTPGTKAYKFGEFAVDATDGGGNRAVATHHEAKWLIDTGTRHFDQNSITAIEDAIVDALTRPGAELPIKFHIDATRPHGSLATADVVPTIVNGQVTEYTITIHCVP